MKKTNKGIIILNTELENKSNPTSISKTVSQSAICTNLACYSIQYSTSNTWTSEKKKERSVCEFFFHVFTNSMSRTHPRFAACRILVYDELFRTKVHLIDFVTFLSLVLSFSLIPLTLQYNTHGYSRPPLVLTSKR